MYASLIVVSLFIIFIILILKEKLLHINTKHVYKERENVVI